LLPAGQRATVPLPLHFSAVGFQSDDSGQSLQGPMNSVAATVSSLQCFVAKVLVSISAFHFRSKDQDCQVRVLYLCLASCRVENPRRIFPSNDDLIVGNIFDWLDLDEPT
jgi:hypothetical protein